MTTAGYRQRLAALMAIWLVWVGGIQASLSESSAAPETAVKAAFFFNFLKFVEWPAERFSATNAPMIVGVAGNDRMIDDLQAVTKGRTINGRQLIVEALDSPESARGVHALWVGEIKGRREDHWIKSVRDTAVLTVGETDSFVEAGGIIRFVIEDRKVRFDINMAAASESGLKISAQLQRLARQISRPNPERRL